MTAPTPPNDDSRVIGVDDAPDPHLVAAAAQRWFALLSPAADDVRTRVLASSDMVDGYTIELACGGASARFVVRLDDDAPVRRGELAACTEGGDGPSSQNAVLALRLGMSELLGGDAGFYRFPADFDVDQHSVRILAGVRSECLAQRRVTPPAG